MNETDSSREEIWRCSERLSCQLKWIRNDQNQISMGQLVPDATERLVSSKPSSNNKAQLKWRDQLKKCKQIPQPNNPNVKCKLFSKTRNLEPSFLWKPYRRTMRHPKGSNRTAPSLWNIKADTTKVPTRNALKFTWRPKHMLTVSGSLNPQTN